MARHFLWVTAQIACSFPKVPILWRVITMIWLKPGVLLQQSVKLSSFLLELSMWLNTEITRWLPNWSFTTSSATRDSPSEQLWLPKPIESETCRLPDADQDTSNTFCWPIILSITPTALTKLRVEKSLKIPLLSQVKYRAFSGRLYWGINACSTVFGFAFTCRWLRYCWTFWPLLQHCQAPGHWSFWRWWQRRLGNQDNPWWPRAGCCFNHLFRHRRWILSSCCDPHPLLSFYTTCRDALTNVGTEPLGVFAFAITSLADDAEACWSNDQVVDPQDWVDELAPAVEKPLRSRMYGYSLENAPELLPSEVVPYDPTDASRLLARERPR